MNSLSDLEVALTPAHLVAYATLVGTQIYQSFVMVKLAYQALPAGSFTSLQKTVFPVYFRCQSVLLVLTVMTFPHGPLALARKKGDWIPFVIAGTSALLNLMVYGPRTSSLMMRRRFLGMFADEVS